MHLIHELALEGYREWIAQQILAGKPTAALRRQSREKTQEST
jgi:hypothetical protein